MTTLPRDLGFFEMNIVLEMPILYKMMKNQRKKSIIKLINNIYLDVKMVIELLIVGNT